jgi:hypothetical protein
MNRTTSQPLICEDMKRTLPQSVQRRRLLAAAGAAVLFSAPVHADLVQIAWDGNGRFERSMTVAPAKFAEVCGKLSKGQSIAWSFTGQQPVNFNIHYHEGKNVVFPEKKDDAISLDGTLSVPVDQDYCWMWENKGSTPASIVLSLKRG